jgi:hypothetical protein
MPFACVDNPAVAHAFPGPTGFGFVVGAAFGFGFAFETFDFFPLAYVAVFAEADPANKPSAAMATTTNWVVKMV